MIRKSCYINELKIARSINECMQNGGRCPSLDPDQRSMLLAFTTREKEPPDLYYTAGSVLYGHAAAQV